MDNDKPKYPIGKNPNSLAALKKAQKTWKPGQSGNPKGRPKEMRYLSEALRDLLRDPEDVRLIAERIIKDAKAGNYNAISLLLERTEGKVPLGLTGDGEITIKVVYEDDRSQAEKS